MPRNNKTTLNGRKLRLLQQDIASLYKVLAIIEKEKPDQEDEKWNEIYNSLLDLMEEFKRRLK